MLTVVPNVRRTTLQPIIEANVRKGAMIDKELFLACMSKFKKLLKFRQLIRLRNLG